MFPRCLTAPALAAVLASPAPAAPAPAPQLFQQETASHFSQADGAPLGPVQLLDSARPELLRAFVGGKWFECRENRWAPSPQFDPANDTLFTCANSQGQNLEVPLPWREVRQIVRAGASTWVAGSHSCLSISDSGDRTSFPYPEGCAGSQLALSPAGVPHLAGSSGLFELSDSQWRPVLAHDSSQRLWTTRNVLGVAFDSAGRLWFATKAGVGCRSADGWRFYEGKDGLPWNDFTGLGAGPGGEIWFATHLGAIRFDGKDWHYRQGKRWLPNDNLSQVLVDARGNAWFATASGVGSIRREPLTLARKAEAYEQEIERYIKRTPFGFVAEASLKTPADKSSAAPQDSDNDGLWTAMYGAGEAFAFGATRDPQAKQRAKQAFEALRFLQKVTQGCAHSPPRGYVARTLRPVEWPDPNIGRIEHDRAQKSTDRLWKVYEPRWPKSADGQWFWKSDTSSDELDGHFFFYPLYFDFCVDTDEERDRVREVVRDLTDHLLSHDFNLIDHDGTPTRWGVYGPKQLNHDPDWWQERGLKSLSMLSYLTVAAHVVGDPKYTAAARELIDRHGYAHNLMHPKVQHGPGSGNQSDDEMAFMCFYSLLRYSKDDALKNLARYSFYRYWLNESPELNPFFNFAYAACGLDPRVAGPYGHFSIAPWPGWFEDSMATLHGFSLDRLDWASRNSHRLDIVALSPIRSVDVENPEFQPRRGHRVNGKVLPIENRHFNHWNTDPWVLNYGGGGEGGELAAGTVFLLPYYMGLYHGFIQKPGS